MKFIQENNVSKVIVASSISIILLLAATTFYYFISTENSRFESEIEKFKTEYIQNQKQKLKREVDSVMHLLYFKTTLYPEKIEEIKEDVGLYIDSVRFGKDKQNYLFVYEVYDINGGKNFAKMLINPNRSDLVGNYISDDYKDINGKQFRKISLADIRENGESFVTYAYKKPNSELISEKLSYFKYYPDFQWIVSAGVYLDEMEELINQKKTAIKKEIQDVISYNALIFIGFSLMATLIFLGIGKQIDLFFARYKKEVRSKTLALERLNKSLKYKIEQEIQKVQEKDQILIQKSKFIALGEMISNIAHQWRQPLSELGAILLNLKLHFQIHGYSKELMEKKTKETDQILEYMSKTIDDFSSFFKPDKKKSSFIVRDSINASMNIMGASLKNNQISIIYNPVAPVSMYTYKSEFEQVLLNILTNAKDAFSNQNISDKTIHITALKKDNRVQITITDNAGGIRIEPIQKVFEPYFTTKQQSGTGIGLYMSKIIIEKNMNGKLEVKNEKGGASFIITLPIEEKV